MAMRRKKINDKWRRLRARRDDTETTRQYTADDVKALAADVVSRNGAGILRPDRGDIHLPSSLEEIGEGNPSKDSPKVIIAIVILALIFISIITYFVSQMPPSGK
jgi:hypothetical protein